MNFVMRAPRRAVLSAPRRAVMSAPRRAVLSAPRYAGIGLVWAWRLTFGALFPTTCKYEPSCSEYAIQAVRKHGLFKGSALTGWRLLRCNPWSHGGYDPVK
jgi:putative membrane protein insertion efficiency factor